jgi:hypothetical protein
MKSINTKNVNWGQPLVIKKEGLRMSELVEVVAYMNCKVGCVVFMSDVPEAPSVLLKHASEWMHGKRPVDQPVILLTAGPGDEEWTLEIYGDFEEEKKI